MPWWILWLIRVRVRVRVRFREGMMDTMAHQGPIEDTMAHQGPIEDTMAHQSPIEDTMLIRVLLRILWLIRPSAAEGSWPWRFNLRSPGSVAYTSG